LFLGARDAQNVIGEMQEKQEKQEIQEIQGQQFYLVDEH
jgi:hypothetical protein